MELRTLIISIFLLSSSAIFSQKATPDFTLTDTRGISFNLYNALDSGKIVVLDFFAVGCQSCQTNTPILESIWNQYGYQGDSLWVWGIESYNATDSTILVFDQQFGATFPTFSTLNDDVVIDAYHITYTPQYKVVCHDKTMTAVDILHVDSAILACKQLLTGIEASQKTDLLMVQAGNTIKINTNKETNFDFTLFSITGGIVYQSREKLVPGINTITIEKRLTKGIYIAKLGNDKIKTSCRFIAD